MSVWRNYGKEGILKPQRTETNRRAYTLNDIKKGKVIHFITRNLLLDLSAVKIFYALFKEKKLSEPEKQLEYMEALALKAGFTKEIQKQNTKKWNNRVTNSKDNKKED